MNRVRELSAVIEAEVAKVIVGYDEAVRLLLLALVCEGHVLFEGVPGVAKTTLARVVARCLGLPSKRVQFTPDLMPSDIVGTQIYDFQAGRFHLVRGPVFTNMLIADEVNRAPAKTQAALLEAMQERQVSIEGQTMPLPQPFLVVATQNPVEQQGTYPLPEAQLDRFLFKIVLDYPSQAEEERIVSLHRGDNAGLGALLDTVASVADVETLRAAKEEALAVQVQDEVARYLVQLVRRTRAHAHLALGASPRAAVLLQAAAKALAALEGRDYVIPDDVKRLLLPCLRHRVLRTAAAEVEGLSVDDVLRSVAESVPVPR
jgi:MoxR-like ATPase